MEFSNDLPQAVRNILLTRKSNGGEFVFLGRVDGRIRLYWIWKEVRRKTGLSDVSLHDQRHSYSTRTVEIGISIPVFVRLLVYANPVLQPVTLGYRFTIFPLEKS